MTFFNLNLLSERPQETARFYEACDYNFKVRANGESLIPAFRDDAAAILFVTPALIGVPADEKIVLTLRVTDEKPMPSRLD